MERNIVQVRRGTKEQWIEYENTKPTEAMPLAGELVVEFDEGKIKAKIGNGINSYSNLPYVGLNEDEIIALINEHGGNNSQIEEYLNQKVDKTNEVSKIYGTNENGEQILHSVSDFAKRQPHSPNRYSVLGYGSTPEETTFDMTANPTGYTLVYRNSSGDFKVNTPTDSSYPTPKSYVDSSNTEVLNEAKRLCLNLDKRIEYLESQILVYTEDSTPAYDKEVPSNAYSYAILKKFDGASKASNNILDPNDITCNVNKTVNEDGSITMIAPAALLSFSILQPGTYYLAVEQVSGWINIITNTTTHDYLQPNSSFTIDQEANIEIELGDLTNWEAEDENYTLKVALFKGEEPHTYEPHFKGIRHAKVERLESSDPAGNILNPESISSSTELIINDDGSISFETSFYEVLTVDIPAGSYFFVCECEESSPTVRLENLSEYVNGSFTITEDDRLSIEFGEFTELVNINAKIGLFKGTEERTFIPFPKIVGTIEIPDFVKNLDGYGYGIDDTYYNYIEYVDGKVLFHKQVIGTQLNGSEDWQMMDYVDTTRYFYLNVGNSGDVIASKLLNDTYKVIAIAGANKNTGIHITNSSTGFARILIRPEDYATLSLQDFKSRLANNPVNVLYAISTPEIKDVTEYFSDSSGKITVQPSGIIRFVNEHKFAVPNTIIYISGKV